MIIYAVCLLLMTVLGAVASLFLKRASESAGFPAVLKSGKLYIGGFLYLGSAVLNVLLLHHLDYSVVLPLTALTYIWTMLLSRFVLKERVTSRKISGIALILIGVVCVSLG